MTMIEMLFNVIGRNREKHCQQSIKWLKDTDNFNTYTDSAVGPIPSVSKEEVVIESLHAVALFKGAQHGRRVQRIRKLTFN